MEEREQIIVLDMTSWVLIFFLIQLGPHIYMSHSHFNWMDKCNTFSYYSNCMCSRHCCLILFSACFGLMQCFHIAIIVLCTGAIIVELPITFCLFGFCRCMYLANGRIGKDLHGTCLHETMNPTLIDLWNIANSLFLLHFETRGVEDLVVNKVIDKEKSYD